MTAEEYFDEWLKTQKKLFANPIDFAEYYHKAKIEAISDEMISDYIEDYIRKYGYKMYDLQIENDCITHSQVENILEWFKKELLKQ